MSLEEWMQNTAPLMQGAINAAGNNPWALEYLVQLGYCARILDNIYDEDRRYNNKDLLDVFEILGAKIPSNPFYQENIKALAPLQNLAWLGWKQANRLCKGTDTEKIYAHVYRDLIYELYPAVALLTQGFDAMIEARHFTEKFFSDSWQKSLQQ